MFSQTRDNKSQLLNLLKSYKFSTFPELKRFIKNNIEAKLSDFFIWIKEDAMNALHGDLNPVFAEVLKDGHELGLDFSPLLSEIIFLEIENFTFSRDLDQCLEWFEQILPCLDIFFQDSIEWKNRMEFHLYKSLCLHRIHSVFDIVTDYPNSIAMINDLKVIYILKNIEMHEKI